MKISRSSVFYLSLMVFIGVAIYSNTFQAPFQGDEDHFLVKNPIIRDLGYFVEPSSAKDLQLYSAFRNRYVGYLTFALNYRIHGLHVTGYHVVNVTLHILNAFLVYAVVLLTFRTPFLRDSIGEGYQRATAFLAALLFLAHPVQTEAVTYVFQRFTSLATFFSLLALVAFVACRLSARAKIRLPLYALSVLCVVVAMKTKENAFSLPLIVALYEFLFFSGPVGRRTVRLIPLLLTLLIIPVSLLNLERPASDLVVQMERVTSSPAFISRAEYFYTSLRVAATYVRLLLFPVQQNFAYDYPLYDTFLHPHVFLSFLLLLSLGVLALYLLIASRRGNRAVRLAAFGILWFFVTLSLESSFIVIPRVINEYRLYLPSVGLFLATATGVLTLMRDATHRRISVPTLALFGVVIVVFSAATFKRNMLWKSPVALWEDVVRKSPDKAYFYYVLGNRYYDARFYDEAEEQYHAATRLEPDLPEAHFNLGLVLIYGKRYEEARAAFERVLRLQPGNVRALRFLEHIAVLEKGGNADSGQQGTAMAEWQRSGKIKVTEGHTGGAE